MLSLFASMKKLSLLRPKCGAEMKGISFIERHQTELTCLEKSLELFFKLRKDYHYVKPEALIFDPIDTIIHSNLERWVALAWRGDLFAPPKEIPFGTHW